MLCADLACSASSSNTGELVLNVSHCRHFMWSSEFANRSGRGSGDVSSKICSSISSSNFVSSVEAGGAGVIV